MYLDALCHTFRHLHIVLTAHVLLNVGSKVIASHADRVVGDDATERDNGNLGATTADVDNHVALGSLNVDTDTDGGCHRLKDKIDIAAVGMLGTVADSTEFNLGRARRHTDYHTQ